jgi:hypothetical protein
MWHKVISQCNISFKGWGHKITSYEPVDSYGLNVLLIRLVCLIGCWSEREIWKARDDKRCLKSKLITCKVVRAFEKMSENKMGFAVSS